MAGKKQIILPITGMTCANCVATIERNVKKLDGVEDTMVNLVTEKATVTYDSDKLDLNQISDRVIRAGYGVVTSEVVLLVQGVNDSGAAASLETQIKKIEGVRSVSVNLSSSRVLISFISTIISRDELLKGIKGLGISATVLSDEQGEDEVTARQRDADLQRRLLIIGILLSVNRVKNPCL